ncbi:MAG: SagB/ThcOx family dehydrogenase [Dehalococcoidia bacterium]|nr:SagB/ThcOx family dehydrogenase [Dehalococcoidia bacterium]
MRYGLAFLILILILTGCGSATPSPTRTPVSGDEFDLPSPRLAGEISLEETLLERRSIRHFSEDALTLAEVSQLLWAAQGITSEQGWRTAPSAGALYPLEVYLVVGNVEGLASGLYKYVPDGHRLMSVKDGDLREELAEVSLSPDPVRNGAVSLVIAAVYERTTTKYGEKGVRYVHMETGHAAQNVYLQAAALGLGNVVLGAFADERLKGVLDLPAEEAPLYIIPVGRP